MYAISLIQDNGERHLLEAGKDKEGIFILGRKVWGVETKRCSRQQVQLKYNNETGSITIRQLGPNDSFVRIDGAAEEAVGKDNEFELRDGDGFFLLQGEHYYQIEVKPLDGQAPAMAGKKRPPGTTGDDDGTVSKKRAHGRSSTKIQDVKTTQRKKRRRSIDQDQDESDYYDPDDPDFVVSDEDVEYEEDEDEDEMEGPDDRLDDVDSRRVCKYGQSCYRKNPLHFAEFAHPWLDKDSSQSNAILKKSGNSAGDVKTRGSSRSSTTRKVSYRDEDDDDGVNEKDGSSNIPNNSKIASPVTRLPPVLSSSSVEDKDADQGDPADKKIPVNTNTSGDTSQSHEDARQSRQPNNKRVDDSNHTNHGVDRIAIASISTTEGQFDVDKAAECASKIIREFLSLPAWLNVECVLVDANPAILNQFHQRLADLPRFRVIQGDISRMRTSQGLACWAIVVETSWRWKPSATASCKAVHERAGVELMQSAKQLYPKPAEIGKAYPVPVERTSPLFMDELVEQVIHVVGPNLNPRRPDCLSNDDDAAAKLELVYTEIFKSFADLRGLTTSDRTTDTKNAFNVLMSQPRSPVSLGNVADMPKSGGRWNDALRPYCLHPEQYPQDVLFYDGHLVVIRDKYPKAKAHLLILPRQPHDGLAVLSREDLPLLDSMKRKADEVVDEMRKKNASLEFRVGFHAIPSMRQLHMHVISQDFDSAALKNKKHWNSFTSEFFRDFDTVRSVLDAKGEVRVRVTSYFRANRIPALVPYNCRFTQSTMKRLTRQC
ncbi:hypothetical protein SpCBS45565_g00458 [Spizellomyces sp. 'palustris']|nr:hypothetical protein SpCBS45565_g00458 [Spizellomyces sp. 'palustris']